jgi:hypothetical protein
MIASVAAGPGAEKLYAGQVVHLIATMHQVEVVPSFQCSN